MNKLKYLLLLVASAMILAACGTSDDGNGDNGNGEPEPGTLVVNVVDADTGAAVEADIAVVDSEGNPVDTQTGVSTFTWSDVEAGSYTVSVSNAEGYLDRLDQTVNVPEGDTVTYNAELTPVDESMADVDSLALDFVDVDDHAYATNEEVNPVKDATLVAAQTEEQVGISVLVTDENGDPVANAPVTVSVTGDFSDSLAIYPGYPVDVSAAAAQTFQGLTTDADGMAYFTIEATNADLTLQEILNFLLGEGFSEDEVLDVFEPIKLIVSATGGNNVAKRVEFKSFFTNMSHLWYGAGELVEEQADLNGFGAAGNTRPMPGNYVEVLPGPDDEDTEVGDVLEYTDQRLGADLGTKFNIWSNQAGASNGHYFGTYALTKQPSRGPFRVGVGSLSQLLENAPVFATAQLGYPSGLAGFFPGYMEYTLSGVSEDEDGNPLVEWDASLCENDLSVDPTTCVDEDGSGVGLVPVSGVGLEDLPIEATVEATYYFVVDYGQESYEFALKDYTFTKEWIGGFLTVDKHVDQHVLTWAGEEVTLPALSPDYDEEYVSTVHVEVSNNSDADIYNVTVRDAVPAELGVVENSISNNGTYDPVNHVVTWNFNNSPSLENILVGESFEFTFDVYARHKPGYCWEGTGDGSFNVQPRYGSTAAEEDEEQTNGATLQQAQDFTCEFAYEDPYRVTNGRQNNSVTAAGFFEDSVEGEQLVFSYSPQADESDIWVVRPLLEIEKTLRSQLVMTEGASATFGITARQIDRVSETVDPANTEYAFLNDRYPWEFTGALGTGTGHEADTSEVRDNPYARDVEVADAWEVGLDFTNGTDFANVDAGGDIDVSDAVVEKEVTWSAIEDLPRGTTAEATLTLTGNLRSDDGDGNAMNNSGADTGDLTQTETVDGVDLHFWENCAYLGAPQLNQPDPASEVYLETWYADETVTPWTQNQIDGVNVLPNEIVSDATADPADAIETYADGAEGLIEDCAHVVVIPPPPEPFMTLTTNGEFQGNGDPEGHDVPQINQGNLEDGYVVDENFVYKITAQNAGGLQAEDVAISAAFSRSVVEFDGQASLYIGDGTPAGWGAAVETISVSGSNAAFSPVAVPDGDFVRVVLEARANQVGVANMVTELTYSNPASFQDVPLQVVEETSVQGN